jgi:hypothetical protein
LPAARLLALVLLVNACAVAQNHSPGSMPGEMRAEIEPSGGFTPSTSKSSPLSATPAPHRVIDKKFIFVMGALGGAESLRFTTRKLVLEHELAAGAPWVTSVPANQHMVARNLLFYGSEFLVAYELKKSHSWLPGDKVIRKLWWVYPAVMTAIHIKNGIGNMRTQGPGGCTSMECAMQMQ